MSNLQSNNYKVITTHRANKLNKHSCLPKLPKTVSRNEHAPNNCLQQKRRAQKRPLQQVVSSVPLDNWLISFCSQSRFVKLGEEDEEVQTRADPWPQKPTGHYIIGKFWTSHWPHRLLPLQSTTARSSPLPRVQHHFQFDQRIKFTPIPEQLKMFLSVKVIELPQTLKIVWFCGTLQLDFVWAKMFGRNLI